MNTLGTLLRMTSFGESHGSGIGAVLDGFPSQFVLDMDAIQAELTRRAPGQTTLATDRKEADKLTVLSGVFENKTTGAPIAFWIENANQKSSDYDALKSIYRPSHADWTYQQKYGYRDHRGGGRASARVTAGWVACGALCKQWLAKEGVSFVSWVSAVGPYAMENPWQLSDSSPRAPLFMPDDELHERAQAYVADLKKTGDSVGGVVRLKAAGIPVGLGEPLLDKLSARLAQAMFCIPAVKGFEIGSGFSMAAGNGSTWNDGWKHEGDQTGRISNHGGGIEGGISNGEPLLLTIAFKPPASIAKKQQTIDQSGEITDLEIMGRHDPCVVPRALPIVEAMAALCIMDFMLMASRQSP